MNVPCVSYATRAARGAFASDVPNRGLQGAKKSFLLLYSLVLATQEFRRMNHPRDVVAGDARGLSKTQDADALSARLAY
jgi:hypothetical protein